MTDRTCRKAQRVLQHLLDRRRPRPLPPRLRDHLQACPSCHAWCGLLQYEATSVEILPADFAGQVVRRYRRAERVRTLLYRGSLFAAAAAVVLALFLGKVLVGGPPRLPEVASTRGESPASPEIMQLVTAVRAGFDKLPDQLSQFSPPSLDLSVPSFTYQPPAPLDASLSSIRSLGDTFQGAVEPLERPAKEAYQKVIEIIDEPDLQKWIQKVKKGTS